MWFKWIWLELHIPNFQEAIKFYKILWFSQISLKEDYLIMERWENIICFYWNSEKIYNHSYFHNFDRNTKRGYWVEIFFFEDNIEKFYEEIKNKVKIVQELKIKPWWKKDFRIEDPFWYYIRIWEIQNY